jgi:transcriptional regulator with XRE-family HTH domain
LRVRIEEIVGQRMRQRREDLKLTQEGLGKLIGKHLGRDWTRQTVSAAEQGGRTFAASDMVTLAYVLGVSVAYLLTPPPGTDIIEFAPGVQAGRDVLVSALAPAMAEGQPQEQMLETVSRLLTHVGQLTESASEVRDDMDLLGRQAMAMQARFCTECGNALPAQGGRCPACGAASGDGVSDA